MKKVVFRLIIPLGIIALALVLCQGLAKLKPQAERKTPPPKVPIVEVYEIQASRSAAVIKSTGTVEAARQVTVGPQVGGRVTMVAENLQPGGRFEKGDLIARIDGSQYAIAVRQQKSVLKAAELALKVEEGRQQIAEDEWKIIGDGRPRKEAELALRQPQLDSAKWNVKGAKSALDRARLDLGRTGIRAPFDAVVLERSVDVGQVLNAGSPVATLVGTDALWVRMAVPVARLEEVDIPGVNAQEGSPATVVQRLGEGSVIKKTGRVIRLVSRIDAQTRTAQVLIEIQKPFETTAESRIPLLPGAYVDVELAGKSEERVFELPRTALFDGGRSWVVDKDSKLVSRAVTVRWGDERRVFVTSKELQPGDRVMTTPLSLPMKGLKVQVGVPEANKPQEPPKQKLGEATP